jgi:serine/threonine-protein kinase
MIEAETPQSGTILAGKYRVEGVLGVGGMGQVLLVTQTHLDERMAMKLLHAPLAQDKDIVGRFMREGKATIKIRSEHVVRVLDVGLLDTGAPYMVMELLEGRDLDRLLRQTGPQPVASTIDLVLQACEALAEAHVQGMVHRDLKPANLYLTTRADGTPLVKVLDFGISKVTGAGGADLGMTKTQSLMGSPLYMAPEQMRSMRQVDGRTDIWALGIIVHQLLSGEVPFQADTLPELCASILQDLPRPLREIRPDIPPGVEAAVLRCLEKEPQKRFGNVAELAAALAEHGTPSARTSAERIARVLGVHGQTGAMTSVLSTAGAQQRTPSGRPGSGPPQSGHHPAAHTPSGPPAPLASSGAALGGPQVQTGTAWGGTQLRTQRNIAVVGGVIGGVVLLGLVVGGGGVMLRHKKLARATDDAATVTPSLGSPSAVTPPFESASHAVASDAPSPTAASAALSAPASATALARTREVPDASRAPNGAGAATPAQPRPTPVARPAAGGLFDDRK